MNTDLETLNSETAAAAEQAEPAPAPKTVAQLEAELAAANAQVSALLAKKDADSAEEILIVDKINRGLTRAQATAAVRRQRAFDESPHGKMIRARHEARQGCKARG